MTLLDQNSRSIATFPKELANVLDSTKNISNEPKRIDTLSSLKTLLASRKMIFDDIDGLSKLLNILFFFMMIVIW